MVLNCFYILNLIEILGNLLLKLFINDYNGHILFIDISFVITDSKWSTVIKMNLIKCNII